MNRCLNQILTGTLMGLSFFVANPSIAEDHPAPVTTVQWEKLKSEEKLKSGEVVVGKEGQIELAENREHRCRDAIHPLMRD